MENQIRSNQLWRWVRTSLLAATVSLAFASVAWGQSWQRYDDDDHYRHDEAREHGYNNGYRDGIRAGQKRAYRDGYERGYRRGYGAYGRDNRYRDDYHWRDRDDWR
jgi:hypothetical protein